MKNALQKIILTALAVVIIAAAPHAAAQVYPVRPVRILTAQAGGGNTVGGTPEAFAAAMKFEMAKWGKLIRESGLREN